VELSRRSRNKWADFASTNGTLRLIEDAYSGQDVLLPAQWEPPLNGKRRAMCAAAEGTIDVTDASVQQRLLAVYLDGVEDWGHWPENSFLPEPHDDELVPAARALVRSLQHDGAPIADDGTLILGANRPQLTVERFDRLGEPRVLLDHLTRIEAGVSSDPAAAIGSAKELVESACKFVLDDYGVSYARNASLPDLYKAVSVELRLSRESVPDSAKGSQAAQRVLQNLMTAVQGLAELRNELGLGHGRTAPSPALARHARLAANSARAVVEFLLETWHARKDAERARSNV
jgi:hypothetical protein